MRPVERFPLRLAGLVCAGLAFAGPAYPSDGAFRVKPPDFVAATPGEIRRTIQPFGDWTLVCDENLKKKERVCNISQTLIDSVGQTAFSWSLTATQAGAPILIVRAPNGAGDGRKVTIRFRETEALIEVALETCGPAVCIGYLSVGPDVAAKLKKGVPAEITLTREGRLRSLDAPTSGLASALAAVK